MEKIKEILSKTFRVKIEDIKENTTINDIDTWDSLTHMELVANLEEGLGIELDGDEIMQMTSVEIIKNIVEEKKEIMDIKDKNILITGGLGGFGLPLAQALQDSGANIFIFDINKSAEFKCFQVDVTDEEQIKQALEQIDKVDVLINCAGEIYSEPFINIMSKEDKKHSRSSWERIINNNLTSTFNMSVQVAEKMATKRTKGVIINFSSVSAKGNAGQVAYSAAKAGVEAMTKVIAKELGVFKIRTVGIAPGFIDTPSTRKAMSEAVLDNWIKQTPLKKLGKVEDIIETVKYIIACDHLTGCTINVDGGLSF